MMASQAISKFEYELYDCPGKHWTNQRRLGFVNELRALALQCLHPIPDYQCLSYSSDALDDKLIVTARRTSDSEIVAFASAVYLSIPCPDADQPPSGTNSFMAFHTGLTCISPDVRRMGMSIELFFHIFTYMTAQHPEGFWLTSLAGIPSSLVSIAYYASQVFPSPFMTKPTAMHLHIAETISKRYRNTLHISPNAVFDPDCFVFRGSNPPGSCFRKDFDDERLQHRNNGLNGFYRSILREEEGNEVLQVGYITTERIAAANNQETRFKRTLIPLQAKL